MRISGACVCDFYSAAFGGAKNFFEVISNDGISWFITVICKNDVYIVSSQ